MIVFCQWLIRWFISPSRPAAVYQMGEVERAGTVRVMVCTVGFNAGVPVSSSPDHFPGAYQIGELQARSWMVAGTFVSGGMFIRTAS
jgi:hypothetical protein